MKPDINKLPSLCFFCFFALLFTGCRIFFDVPPYTPSPQEQQNHAQIDVAEQFLQEILIGDEDTSASYLSANMRSAVDQHCGGRVVDCLVASDIEIGEKISHFLFEAARPATDTVRIGAVLFLVVWENRTYNHVVVLVINEDGRWVVDGWRGWDQNPDGLLSGKRQINIFPPLE